MKHWMAVSMGSIWLLAASFSSAADFNGDGKDDLALFRPATGLWAVKGVSRFYFGAAGDIPVPGNYNSTPACEAAVFRRSSNRWLIRGISKIYFGAAGDLPLGETGGGLWTSDGTAIYYTGGNVGIGVAEPQLPLHVSYAVKVGDSTVSSPFISFENSAGSVNALGLYSASKDLYLGYGNSKLSLRTNTWPRLTIDSAGNVGIGTQTPSTKLAVLGLTGTSSFNNVKVNTATGDFYYESSSERYKNGIKKLETDFNVILQAEPKTYRDRVSGGEEIGYIAEEFDSLGLKNLVIYNGEGRPDGLKYERMVVYLAEIVKEQQRRIAALEREVATLERNPGLPAEDPARENPKE